MKRLLLVVVLLLSVLPLCAANSCPSISSIMSFYGPETEIVLADSSLTVWAYPINTDDQNWIPQVSVIVACATQAVVDIDIITADGTIPMGSLSARGSRSATANLPPQDVLGATYETPPSKGVYVFPNYIGHGPLQPQRERYTLPLSR